MASASNKAKSHFMRTTFYIRPHHTWRGELREPAVGGVRMFVVTSLVGALVRHGNPAPSLQFNLLHHLPGKDLSPGKSCARAAKSALRVH